jgi:hypothetical protein
MLGHHTGASLVALTSFLTLLCICLVHSLPHQLLPPLQILRLPLHPHLMSSSLHNLAHPINLHMPVLPLSVLFFQQIVLPCTAIVTLGLT